MSKPSQSELKARAGAPFWWDALPSVDEELSLPERADVVVIGVGYTGLSAALTLARAGRDVLVLDANSPGTGVSTRNPGFFGSALKVSLSGLMRGYGRETEMALSRTARDGFEFSKGIIETEQFQCNPKDFGRPGCAARLKDYDALAREADLLNTHSEFIGRSALRPTVTG